MRCCWGCCDVHKLVLLGASLVFFSGFLVLAAAGVETFALALGAALLLAFPFAFALGVCLFFSLAKSAS